MRVLCVNFFVVLVINKEFRICFVRFIIFFYVLFMWDECGGLNIYIVLLFNRNCLMGLFFILMV